MELVLVTGWLLGVLLIPLVAYRRRLTSALSWIAVMLALPWVGPLLFLLLAQRRGRRWARRREDAAAAGRRGWVREVLAPFLREPEMGGERARALSALSDRLGGFPLVGGNRVVLREGGGGAVEALVEDVSGARSHVHLLFYTIEDDGAGGAVARALQEAAARGVRCRVLADAVGSRRFHRRLAPRLREAGVDVRKGLTFPFLLRRLRAVDLRNHRKLAIVDGRVAHTGSMNLQDGREPPAPEGERWHDLMVQVEGPVVLQLQTVFLEDWAWVTGGVPDEEGLFPAPRAAGHTAVQVLPSGPGPGADAVHHLLVAALDHARYRVVIATPYLIPDEPTRVALRLAALRGVEVDIIVPERSDVPLASLAGRAWYRELLDDGIRIHHHRRGFLHAKTLTVDREIAVLGSANFDRRSFFLNFELNLVLWGPEAVVAVDAMHREYLDDAEPLDPATWRERGLARRVAEDVARLLSPLL